MMFWEKRILVKDNLDDSLRGIHNSRGLRMLKFATSAHPTVKVWCSHIRVHKCTWICPEGKTCNQICHILV